MKQLDEFSLAYLRLILEINKHIDGYIDAYYGPSELKAEVLASPKKEPAYLQERLVWLKAHIPTADMTRHDYLTKTLRAIECTIALIAGEEIGYLEEVQRIYDVDPQLVDEAIFREAHQLLDTVLPEQGDLATRLLNWRSRYFVPTENVLSLLELAREETYRRTAVLFELPTDESVEIKLTQNQPWGAYNWFLGQGKSLIEFNTDVKLSALNLIGTFAHEGYPGHHTEAILKEKHLYEEKGYGEQSAMLLHSPAAVIAEGIATTAIDMIFPYDEDSQHHWNANVLLPAANLPTDSDTATQLQAISQALTNLKYVSTNVAILLHTGQMNEEQVIDYIKTYSFASIEQAKKRLSFMTHPLFRSYVFTYTQGNHLIAQAAPTHKEKEQLFGRLLTEQLLPSKLAKLSKVSTI